MDQVLIDGIKCVWVYKLCSYIRHLKAYVPIHTSITLEKKRNRTDGFSLYVKFKLGDDVVTVPTKISAWDVDAYYTPETINDCIVYYMKNGDPKDKYFVGAICAQVDSYRRLCSEVKQNHITELDIDNAVIDGFPESIRLSYDREISSDIRHRIVNILSELDLEFNKPDDYNTKIIENLVACLEKKYNNHVAKIVMDELHNYLDIEELYTIQATDAAAEYYRRAASRVQECEEQISKMKIAHNRRSKERHDERIRWMESHNFW